MAKGFKTGGRDKGTPNKISTTIKEALQLILEEEVDKLPEMLSSIPTEKRVEMLARLLPLVVTRGTFEVNQPLILLVTQDELDL